MKQLSCIVIGLLFVLVIASSVFAQTPWFDSFPDNPGYTPVDGSYPNELYAGPWVNNAGIAQFETAGYEGSYGVKGMAQAWVGGTTAGRMYRAGGGTDAYVVWKSYLGLNGNPGSAAVCLTPFQSTRSYGLAYAGTWLEIDQGSTDQSPYDVLMMSFSSDDTGAEVANRAGVQLARDWYEFKLQATGLQVSSYYRVAGTSTWNLIGTQTQDAGFAPTYVGVCLGSRGFADDIGFNTEGPVVPEPSALLALASGLIGLAGFGIRRRK